MGIVYHLFPVTEGVEIPVKKQTRIYNVIFPIWLLILFPQLLVYVLPGNLIIDCAV